MPPKARELETLLLAMFAALPLYFTSAIGIVPLILFHVFMALVMVKVALGRGPDVLPLPLMRTLAALYVPFYFADWLFVSDSAVAASTHLVLFIAAYQPMESLHRNNHAQRMLTAGLIFTAAVATSTHITIAFFVAAFAYLIFRQMMYVSHLETVRSLDLPYDEQPSAKASFFYLAGATIIAAMLFPLLPRVRNPFVQGITGSLPGASTGLSESIDFRDPRDASSGDTTVVARVWLDLQARPFFTPIRLRGNIYDRYGDGEWQQTFRGLRIVNMRDGAYILARPDGFARKAVVQTRPMSGKLFLPVGSYMVGGVNTLYEGPTRDTYHTYDRTILNLDVSMAYETEPLRLVRPGLTGYPLTPQVTALAQSIVGNETEATKKAALIERYLVRNFRYLPNDAAPTQGMPLDQFLLVTRAGHCEYFAAGMVALLNAVDVPARIAGGFYGGRLNPLTGYYALRREDAHAWTEVWDGRRWLTYDATPPALRPGSDQGNLLRTYFSAVADSVTYFWDRYILTFGLADQITLFADLMTWTRETSRNVRASFGIAMRELASAQFLGLMLLVIAAGIALIAFFRRRTSPFDLLAAFLKERGIEVSSAMTLEEALLRLSPEDARAIAPLVRLYEEEEFSGRRDAGRRRALRLGVRRLAAAFRR